MGLTDASDTPCSRLNTDTARFRLFVIAWGIAVVVLFAEQRLSLVVHGRFLPMPVLVPFGLGFWAALRPQNLALFLAFWATYVYFLLLGLPDNNTNETLSLFVGLAIVGCAGAQIVRARSLRISSEALFEQFAPVVRLCLIALYFWTVFHKLNADFLNPDVSCAARLSEGLFGNLGIGHFPAALAGPMVLMTIVVEGALPIGLSFRRTQRITAFVGLIFHWLLGLAGFYGFSATMMALLTLSLNNADARRLLPRRPALLLALGAVSSVLVLKTSDVIDPSRLLQFVGLLLPLICGAIWWMNRAQPSQRERAPEAIWRLMLKPRPMYIVPLLLFINGASPYLGFKTEYSYAMYSNLRTEGGQTNHLIWRTPLRLAGYQTDLVRVLPGTHRAILNRLGGRPVTRYELTSLLWRLVHEQGRSELPVILDVDGVRYEYAAADRSSALMVAPTPLERYLLRFRKIVPPAMESCAH
jgi:hypothetical protein